MDMLNLIVIPRFSRGIQGEVIRWIASLFINLILDYPGEPGNDSLRMYDEALDVLTCKEYMTILSANWEKNIIY